MIIYNFLIGKEWKDQKSLNNNKSWFTFFLLCHRASTMYESTTENSPWLMHHVILFKEVILKISVLVDLVSGGKSECGLILQLTEFSGQQNKFVLMKKSITDLSPSVCAVIWLYACSSSPNGSLWLSFHYFLQFFTLIRRQQAMKMTVVLLSGRLFDEQQLTKIAFPVTTS